MAVAQHHVSVLHKVQEEESRHDWTSRNATCRKETGRNAAIPSNTWCCLVVKTQNCHNRLLLSNCQTITIFRCDINFTFDGFSMVKRVFTLGESHTKIWFSLYETRNCTNDILFQRVCPVILPRTYDAGHRFLRAEGSSRNHLRPWRVSRAGAERLCCTLWTGIRNTGWRNPGEVSASCGHSYSVVVSQLADC